MNYDDRFIEADNVLADAEDLADDAPEEALVSVERAIALADELQVELKADVTGELLYLLADAHLLRGNLLAEMDRLQDAAQSYERALHFNPRLREARKGLRQIQDVLGSPPLKGVEGMDQTPFELVTVAHFSTEPEAYIVRGRLESEGVRAVVADDGIVSSNWLYSNVVGGVKVRVAAEDEQRAREIIATPVDPDPEWYTDANDDERCPNCGSADIEYEGYYKRAVFISWLILRFPLPFLKRRWSCLTCGYQWREFTGNDE